VVEAESSKIGECRVPPMLWKAMVAAPRVTISAPRAARAEYLARAYADLTADAGRLVATVDLLKPLQPREVIEGWQALAATGDFVALADSLMERHYDPRYGKHRERMATPLVDLMADRLDEADLPGIAERLAGAIKDQTGR
jgi:tRNA 2-selenouridine synthase